MNNKLKKDTEGVIEDGTNSMPDGVTEIGWYAFEECTSLTSITIPDGVTDIGNGAFYGCTGLRSISLPKNVQLGDYVFAGCSTALQIEYR